MANNAFDSGPYKRVVQAARANNLAGTQHHLYYKHFKEWCKGKSPEEIAAEISPQKHVGTKKTSPPKVLSKEEAKAATQKLQAVTASVAPVPITKTKQIQDKEQDEQLKEQRKLVICSSRNNIKVPEFNFSRLAEFCL